MPELPEVETIRKTLALQTIGKEIETVEVYWPRIIQKPADPDAFCLQLQNQTIHHIGRRGKFLIFYLDDVALVSHLRMEGKYECGPIEERDKHTHVRFFLKSGEELRYKDVRKFGTMHLFPKGEEQKALPLSQLGPEPYQDPAFTPTYLREICQKTTRHIKTVLLDQKAIAGLGNIYVDEALYQAKIRPDRAAASLSNEEVRMLHEKIVTTIENAVQKGGSTVRSYVNGRGEAGKFQLELLVYGRKGQPCYQCGEEIVRTVVANRGTHYCPVCQSK